MISTDIPNAVVQYHMDFEGDGVVDYTGTTFDNVTYTYTVEGVYHPRIMITDDQGITYTDSIAITVLNREKIDAILKGKWEKVKAALTAGDIEGALDLFTVRSREKYRILFNALKDDLPMIIGTFVEFNLENIYDIIAEFELVANENGKSYSYPVIFIRNGDGTWKLRNF